MDNYFISFHVKSCCCLQLSYIWTMTKFSLCVTTEYLVFFNQRHPLLDLLLIAKSLHSRLKHSVVHPHTRWQSLGKSWPVNIRIFVNWRSCPIVRVIDLQKAILAPKIRLLLIYAHFKKLMVVTKLIVLSQDLFKLHLFLVDLNTSMDRNPQLLLIKITLLPFFQKIWSHNFRLNTTVNQHFTQFNILSSS